MTDTMIKYLCSTCKGECKRTIVIVKKEDSTEQSASDYIKKCKEKGLTYWSAMDYLKHHKTMHSII